MRPPSGLPADRARRTVVVGGFLLSVTALAGCTEQGPSGDTDVGQDAITSGNGTITEWRTGSRPARVDFKGATDTGSTINSEKLLGGPVVLNFWYAGCPPCRAEAPDLEALWQRYRGQGVAFIGVNVRDGAVEAQAFARQFKITYPSIIDTDGGVQLAFAGKVSMQAVPTTLVLDRDGRAAARIIGKLPSRGVLDTLIRDQLAAPGR